MPTFVRAQRGMTQTSYVSLLSLIACVPLLLFVCVAMLLGFHIYLGIVGESRSQR